MILATPSQMKEADRKAIEDYGIPGIVLMENAAAGICEEIIKLTARMSKKNVLFLCGKGNNGGDGFAAARRLFCGMYDDYPSCPLRSTNISVNQFMIKILVLAERNELAGDARANFDICENLKMDITFVNNDNVSEVMKRCLKDSDLVVDGIFGTGFKGKANGLFGDVIQILNHYRRNLEHNKETRLNQICCGDHTPSGNHVLSGGDHTPSGNHVVCGGGYKPSGNHVVCGGDNTPSGMHWFRNDQNSLGALYGSGVNSDFVVLSIDVPSGLNAETGIAAGGCVKADVTVTLGIVKIGLVSGKDSGNAGRVICRDIGIPKKAINAIPFNTFLVTRDMVKGLLKSRNRDSHKGDYGRVMLITGSPGMSGAGCLAADAAFRTGAGLVYLGVPGELSDIYESAVKEAITVSLGGKTKKRIGLEEAREALSIAAKMDVIAIGPGMSQAPEVADAIYEVVSKAEKPLVIDADALNALASRMSKTIRICNMSSTTNADNTVDLINEVDAVNADSTVNLVNAVNSVNPVNAVDAVNAVNAVNADYSVNAVNADNAVNSDNTVNLVNADALSNLKAPAVLTPHEGEMARLIHDTVKTVHENRMDIAREFAKMYGVTVVLKGSRTLIATPDGELYINPTGNPGMATAGAGDVLTGMIAAIVAGNASEADGSENMSTKVVSGLTDLTDGAFDVSGLTDLTDGAFDVSGLTDLTDGAFDVDRASKKANIRMLRDAVVAAVFLHGLAGDMAAAELGETSVKAGDIISYIPHAINSVVRAQ